MEKIVSQRKNFIDDNINTANENNKKADELSVEREEKLDGAKNDARTRYNESVNGFKEQRTMLVKKTQDETNNELTLAYENLNNISNQTKEGLKGKMTDLANDIVEKVLGYRSEVQGFDNDTVNNILYR